MDKPTDKKSEAKDCNEAKCSNPNCDNQDPAERGPGTRRDLSDFKEGNGCPQYEPKLIGTVNMGEKAMIDIKIARTGVKGNLVRTDYAAKMLKHHLDQPLLDRMALRVLR